MPAAPYVPSSPSFAVSPRTSLIFDPGGSLVGLCAGRELLRCLGGGSLSFSAARGFVGGSLSYGISCGFVGRSLRRSSFSEWLGAMLYMVEIRSTGTGNGVFGAGFLGGGGGGGRDVRNGPVLSISRMIAFSSSRSYSSETSEPMSITTCAYSRVHACRRMSPPIARCVAIVPSGSSQSNRAAALLSLSSQLKTARASSPSALIRVRNPSARGSQVANHTGRSASASRASDFGPGPFAPSLNRTRNASTPRSSTGLAIPNYTIHLPL